MLERIEIAVEKDQRGAIEFDDARARGGAEKLLIVRVRQQVAVMIAAQEMTGEPRFTVDAGDAGETVTICLVALLRDAVAEIDNMRAAFGLQDGEGIAQQPFACRADLGVEVGAGMDVGDDTEFHVVLRMRSLFQQWQRGGPDSQGLRNGTDVYRS